MPSIKEQIIIEIKSHIQNNGGKYSDWYIGICTDIGYKLLVESKSKHLFIARQAYSAYVAAEVRDYFVDTLRTGGCAETDNGEADIIYAYRKLAGPIEDISQSNDMTGEVIK